MAIQNISYGDKTDLNTTSVPDANKVKASDMNEIKTVVNNNANLQYPVGSVITNDSSTNPGSTLGGTWVQVPCHALIESGSISNSSGITLGLAQYRLYANGDLEVFGYTQAHTLTHATLVQSNITLPYTTQSGVVNVSLAYGGVNWGNTALYGYSSGNKIYFAEWQNFNDDATLLKFSFHAICTVDLQGQSISTKYSWERTA